MSRAFVVGGDLPRAHLGGRELRKITGWRPMLDTEVGSVVGVMLERLEAKEDGLCLHRLTVVQNGARRCSVEAEIPQAWREACSVHGVVDVCGTVQCVELRQAMPPPAAPPPPPAPVEPPSVGAVLGEPGPALPLLSARGPREEVRTPRAEVAGGRGPPGRVLSAPPRSAWPAAEQSPARLDLL
mmetsp:Transcript_12674/g.32860  ORF Transcript_12674/g.32860 Transcript_12674/m.32860 type:complete len:184 (+) Transcript_12674:1-552(+)